LNFGEYLGIPTNGKVPLNDPIQPEMDQGRLEKRDINPNLTSNDVPFTSSLKEKIDPKKRRFWSIMQVDGQTEVDLQLGIRRKVHTFLN